MIHYARRRGPCWLVGMAVMHRCRLGCPDDRCYDHTMSDLTNIAMITRCSEKSEKDERDATRKTESPRDDDASTSYFT